MTLVLGVFIARGKEDALVTKNIVPGESVYGEKRISVDVRTCPLHHSIILFSCLKNDRVYGSFTFLL